MCHGLTEQGVGKATGDVRTIVLQKDASLQDKSNKFGAYVLVSRGMGFEFVCMLTCLGSRQACRRRNLQLRSRCQGKQVPMRQYLATD
jgi:hypothetical protein